MITVKIDELTPCLKNGDTGELIETEVVRIKNKSFLTKFNKKNGWYVNWYNLIRENEVYALVIKESKQVQGLIALKGDLDSKAVYINWMATNPKNNKKLSGKAQYLGVGGHLFAIAINRSCEMNFNGAVYGFAANDYLLNHYINELGAEYLGLLHPYHFWISEIVSKQIKEIYTYEQNGKEW